MCVAMHFSSVCRPEAGTRAQGTKDVGALVLSQDTAHRQGGEQRHPPPTEGELGELVADRHTVK